MNKKKFALGLSIIYFYLWIIISCVFWRLSLFIFSGQIGGSSKKFLGFFGELFAVISFSPAAFFLWFIPTSIFFSYITIFKRCEGGKIIKLTGVFIGFFQGFLITYIALGSGDLLNLIILYFFPVLLSAICIDYLVSWMMYEEN